VNASRAMLTPATKWDNLIISTLIALIIFVAIIALAPAAKGDEKVLIANTDHYRTSVVLTGAPGSSYELSDCVLGGAGIRGEIPEEGVVVVRNVGDYLCSSGYLLLDAPADVQIQSIMRYLYEPATSFVLSPLRRLTETPVQVGPLVSDDEEGSWVTVFVSETTPIRVEFSDGTVEDFEATPSVYQYRIQRKGAFYARIALGHSYWGCYTHEGGCSAVKPVYGFANSGTTLGGTFRSFGF
jgi:hypothetical protein